MLSLGAWLFITSMRYCGCEECYGRYLFRERSFTLMIQPAPAPRFYWETCEAGWRFGLGWFRLCIYRQPYQSKRWAD